MADRPIGYNPFFGAPPDPNDVVGAMNRQAYDRALHPDYTAGLTLQDHVAIAKAPKLPTATPSWITNPGPRTYDLRSEDPNSTLDLSLYGSGDVIKTPGADISFGWNGAPKVQLHPGFENGRHAGDTGPILIPPAPRHASVDRNSTEAHGHSPFWFLRQVPNKQPWDYKQQGRKYEAFGNFNYGAAGRAARLPDAVLLRGAGWAQEQAGTSDPKYGSYLLGTGSFGDDPVDQYWIQQGARYHERR